MCEISSRAMASARDSEQHVRMETATEYFRRLAETHLGPNWFAAVTGETVETALA
jgi:hypothetical protein